MKLLGIAIIVSLCNQLIAQEYEISYLQPYRYEKGDTTLTKEFITQLCLSIRNKAESTPGFPSYFEQLLNLAAGTHYRFESQKPKVYEWWSKYSTHCTCESEGKKFPAGGLLRQMVHSNFRELANIIGPNGRLTLDLTIPDPIDGMTILEYVKEQRDLIEGRYNQEMKKYQKDVLWKDMTFFMMLFTEYEVQDAVNSQKNK